MRRRMSVFLTVGVAAAGAAAVSPCSALALVQTPDVESSLNALGAGSATAAQAEVGEASVDWTEYMDGVSPSSVTYPTIAPASGGQAVGWQSDPYVSDFQTSANSAGAVGTSAASEGGTATDVFGEVEGIASDVGLSAGDAEAATAVCAGSAGLGCLGAVVVGTGALVFNLLDGSSDAVTPQTYTGIIQPSETERVWMAYNYAPAKSFGGNIQCNNGATGFPTQGASNQGLQASTLNWYGGSDFPACNGWPGGGFYIAAMQYASGAVTNKWVASAIVDHGDGTVGNGCSSALASQYHAPLIGSLPTASGGIGQHGWLNIVDTQATAAEDHEQCNSAASGATPDVQTVQGEAAVEPATALKATEPKAGACGSGCTAIASNPSSSWCTPMAKCLGTELSSPFLGDLQNFMDAAINATSPSGQTYSMPGTATVPSCTGQSVSACSAAVSAAGFTASPSTSTVPNSAVVTADGAGNVVTSSPAPGAVVDTGTAIVLDVNPNPLPIVIPPPNSGESYQAYIARLQALGVTGTITEQDLTDANEAPSQGPGVAISTSPAAGTLVSPSASVTVYANPESAPQPASGASPAPGSGASSASGSFAPPAVPALNLAPLSQGLNCSSFPFGVPCWVASTVGSLFSAPGTCPDWQQGLGPSSWGLGINVNLCTIQPARDIWWPAMIAVSFIGLAWMFFKLVIGQGDGGDGE